MGHFGPTCKTTSCYEDRRKFTPLLGKPTSKDGLKANLLLSQLPTWYHISFSFSVLTILIAGSVTNMR